MSNEMNSNRLMLIKGLQILLDTNIHQNICLRYIIYALFE